MKKSQRLATGSRAAGGESSDSISVSSSNSSGSGYRTRNKVKTEKVSSVQNPSKGTSASEENTSSGGGSGSGSGSSTVQVSVRVRPMVSAEQDREEPLAWLWGEHNTITQDPQYIPKRAAYNKDGECPSTAPAGYTFDHLYTPDSTNQHIYESNVHHIVHQTLEGFHGSVFTYGQTSSGKTYTMNGTLKQPGIIPQAIYDCFNSIHLFSDREFLFRVSYLEIYNETINDLLNPDPKAQIKIQHDPKVGTKMSGVKEQVVMNPAQVVALLQGGEAYRHISSTDMNDKSSRAHTLFKLIVESKSVHNSSDRHVRVSTLNLVDLAGSENAKMTNSTGDRAREAKFINQSLLTLSTIIHKLSEESVKGSKKRGAPVHLPYRDSKLTRILQTALSGNAYISIICTISPTVKCSEESHNTLKFASRAKKIKMKAEVNESIDDKTLLSQYREEINLLKSQLAQFQQMQAAGKATEIGGANGPNTRQRAAESESDKEAEKENEDYILQMIGHMERLILKGDYPHKPPSLHHSPTKHPKLIDRRRSDVSTVSTHVHQKKPLSAEKNGNNKKTLDNTSISQEIIEGKGKKEDANGSNNSSSSHADNELTKESKHNFKDAVEVQIDNPFKSIIEENIPDENVVNEELQIDENDDFFAELSRLSICGSPTRTRTTSQDNLPASGITTHVERPARQPFVINPRRVTLSFPSESGMRKITKSRDSDDNSPVLRSSTTNSNSKNDSNREPCLEDLADQLKEDPVLYGVSQMLSMLKQHVSKPKVKSLPIQTNDVPQLSKTVSVGSISDNEKKSNVDASLREEIARLQANVDKKDSMLSMLTDGLKEVEVNQATLLARNEELEEELDITQQAYYEVEEENKLIRAEVLRLQGCLETREKQLFDLTGKSPDDEQF